MKKTDHDKIVKVLHQDEINALRKSILDTIQVFENRMAGEGRNASGEDYNALVNRLLELVKA